MNECIHSDDPSKIIYITPEKLVKSELLNDLLKQLYNAGKLDLFVIDEAHCVSQWGRDFREDYLRLGILKKNFPKVPTLALTATATEKVKVDIVN